MIRSELVTVLAERQPHLLKHDVELVVNSMLEQMADALVRGERIEIRDFGSFNLHSRPARIARNPKTGEAVQASAKGMVCMSPVLRSFKSMVPAWSPLPTINFRG